MKTNSNLVYAGKIKIIFTALICLLVVIGCNRKDDEPEPEPPATGGGIDTLKASDFNSGGSGGIVDYWATSSDSIELTVGKIALPPNRTAPDSAFHLVGTDTDADWFIGTALGHSATAFGLPADTSKISLKFDFYASNATSNIDLQLQEADGDVFIFNLGSAGLDLTGNVWKTFTIPFGRFVRTTGSWGNTGDNVLNSAVLKNVSFALISGVATGNSADVYIDNVEFIVEK